MYLGELQIHSFLHGCATMGEGLTFKKAMDLDYEHATPPCLNPTTNLQQ